MTVVGLATVVALRVHLEALSSGGMAAEMSEQLTAVADRLQEQVRANILSRLTMRSRSLVTSVRGDVAITPEHMDVVVSAGGDTEGLRVRYARLQELGGVVRPVKGQYLAIPVGPALTGPGIPRAPSPRLVPGLAFAQTLRGQPVLLKAATGEVWYILRKMVVVPPKFFMRDALAEVVRGVPAELAETAARAVTS